MTDLKLTIPRLLRISSTHFASLTVGASRVKIANKSNDLGVRAEAPIAEHLLHRSGRAPLPHAVPTDSKPAQAGEWIGVTGAEAKCRSVSESGVLVIVLPTLAGVSLGRETSRSQSLDVVHVAQKRGETSRVPSRYLSYPLGHAVRVVAALSPERVAFEQVSLCSIPTFHRLRGRSFGLLRLRPSFNHAGFPSVLPWRRTACCLPLVFTASAPRSNQPRGRTWISQLNIQHALACQTLRPRPLRAPMPDSGPI
jgi:hypothetical protein